MRSIESIARFFLPFTYFFFFLITAGLIATRLVNRLFCPFRLFFLPFFLSLSFTIVSRLFFHRDSTATRFTPIFELFSVH